MSDGWTEQDARDWLDKGLAWLREQWQDDPDRSWSDLESGLLDALGVAGKDDHVVVAALFAKVEEKSDDDGVYEMFTTEDQETELIDHLLAVWREDQAAQEAAEEPTEEATGEAEDQVDTTKPYWDGERWLEYDEASGEWVPAAEADSPAADQDSEPDAESEDAAAEPEQVSADIAEKIAAPALAEAMANSAAVRDLSSEERDALLGEVVAARMATS